MAKYQSEKQKLSNVASADMFKSMISSIKWKVSRVAELSDSHIRNPPKPACDNYEMHVANFDL